LNQGSGEFRFPGSASVDVVLRRRLSWGDLDLRYFGVQQATAAIGPYAGSWSLSWPFSVVDFATLASSLQSAELNLRREISANVAFLVGFRYVQFREALGWQEDVDGTWSFMFDWRAQNELFGFQVGSELIWLKLGDRFSVESSAKVGVFGNAASSRFYTEAIYYSESIGGQSFNAYRGSTSIIADINVTANYALTRRLVLRGGYQLIGIGNVATATGQLDVAAPFHTVTDEGVLFQGAMVGLECGW
jgi:hypothetical protein